MKRDQESGEGLTPQERACYVNQEDEQDETAKTGGAGSGWVGEFRGGAVPRTQGRQGWTVERFIGKINSWHLIQ